MQKSALRGSVLRPQALLKTVIVMKLAIFIVLFTAFQVKASPSSGQNVNLSMNNSEIKKVLKTIERDGNFRFLYNSELKDIKKKVNFSASNMSVSEALKMLFAGTNLTYKVLNNNLVVVTSTVESENRAVRVTGKITGDNGEPLAGVSVQEKGTSNGTSTDNSGTYTITVDNNATLVISSIGFENVEVKVNGRSVVDVKLTQAVKKVDEVVVIGYGTASKRDLTGSIVKISGKDIQDKPNTNPVASLQGRVAGLSVVNNGTPGAAPDIRIRGTVSIGQVHPLYVVDGIFNDNIDYINPNDIESIEVLKDPSSLAIFGVKGATGVIAITTKKAKAGQVVVNFNTAYGTKKLVDKIAMANSDQFNTLFAEENANNGVATPNYSALTANTDWVKAVTRTGKFNTNNLSVSGSTDKNRFTMGVGFTTDEGIIIHEKLSKWQLSFSDEFKLNKAVKIGINLNTTRQNNPFGAGGILDAARKVMPNVSAETKAFKVANPYVGGSYLPDNLLFDFDGRKASTAEAKNVYGFQMARSSYEAAIENESNRRPFVLTRSGFAGVQRYAAIWSGDNTASDEGLLRSVLLNNTMGISGISFCGYDIGGYIGDASKTLFTRWMQVGMFSPFCRNHRGFFTVAGEPWAYGEETEAISKNFIEFRYRMMPYLYASFYEAAQTGMPVARSLSINYPYDEKVFDNTYQYQFLFGPSMMVVPVTSEEKNKKIYLPSGEWYNVYTDEKINGKKEWKEEVPLYQLPLYIKASAIIPMQTVVQSTKEKPSDTIFIHVYNGKEKNSFTYYEDEGDGFGYKNGKYCKRNFVFEPLSKQINIEQQEGNYTSGFKKIQFILHGFETEMKNILINGASVVVQPCSSKLLDGLQGLQDYYDPAYYTSLRNAEPVMKQQTIITNNISSAIHIQW